ncbi:reverse transcriptase domain-containing protein [Tanacetum coccineum]|uniref:Reverse transcriptase domain-containing protein n=1 Tax=Tanacetum coccineum TaxID=301880 RepID=A0ABQ5HKL2_9ASTR
MRDHEAFYTRNLSWDHGSGVSDHFKQTTSLEKYIKDLAACTPVLDPWSLRLPGQDITGQQCTQMRGDRTYKWGIDIAGPFPEGPSKVKFLIVAIDYFTKWIEAMPVATITGNQVKKFVWDNIVCRFRLPGEIVSDNGKQFHDNPFKDWCEKLLDLIKNDEALEINLDLIEEKREQGAIQEAKSKAKMEKYYNSKVRGTSFKPRDMVYRSNDVSHAEDGGKLRPKWEGPYEVTESLGMGAYKLKDRNGNELPRT